MDSADLDQTKLDQIAEQFSNEILLQELFGFFRFSLFELRLGGLRRKLGQRKLPVAVSIPADEPIG